MYHRLSTPFFTKLGPGQWGIVVVLVLETGTGNSPRPRPTVGFRATVRRLPFSPSNLSNLPIKTCFSGPISARLLVYFPIHKKCVDTLFVAVSMHRDLINSRSSRTTFARHPAGKGLGSALASWSAVASPRDTAFGRRWTFKGQLTPRRGTTPESGVVRGRTGREPAAVRIFCGRTPFTICTPKFCKFANKNA